MAFSGLKGEHPAPKCRALPVEPHPDIHFSAMIPRRTVKIKIFLSVVIYVVKAAFMPLSATGRNPANTGVTRLCGVSPHPVPDTATALPKQARYQLRYTRLFSLFIRLGVFSQIKRDTNFAIPGYLVLWGGESLCGAVCAGDAACKATAWSIDSADGVCAGRSGGDNAYPTMFRGKKQQGAGRFSAGTLFCVTSRRALRFCAL